MSSDDIASNQKIDGDNRFLWRMPRQRLEGEIIRDSILEVSGSLNREIRWTRHLSLYRPRSMGFEFRPQLARQAR